MNVLKIMNNQTLPIQLQLFDGSEYMPLRVFVDLTDPSGVLLYPRFEISHMKDGDFRHDSKTMPEEDYVVAQYFVYANDGVTRELAYEAEKDIFLRDIIGELINGGQLEVSVQKVIGALTGNIINTQIDGTVTDETMSGTVSEDNIIIGVIENE